MPGQSASSEGLDHMINNKAVAWKEIKNIYDDIYTEYSLLLDVEDDDNDKVRLFSHAPINEVDVLRAALCLIDPKEGHDLALNDADEASIRLSLSHAKGEKGLSFNNDDLRVLRTIVNKAVSYHAKQRTLTKLLGRTLDENAFDLYFGDGYGEEGTCPYHPTKPFQYILWNRNHPLLNKANTKVVSTCDYTNVHGHVGENPAWVDAQYINLDSKLGSNDAYGDMIAVGKLTFMQSAEKNNLTMLVANNPCPPASEIEAFCKSIIGRDLSGDDTVSNEISTYARTLAAQPKGWPKQVAALQRAQIAKRGIVANRESISAYESFYQRLFAVQSLIPEGYPNFKEAIAQRQKDILALQRRAMQGTALRLTRKQLQTMTQVAATIDDVLTDDQLQTLNRTIAKAYAARFQLRQDPENQDLQRAYQDSTTSLVSEISELKDVMEAARSALVSGIKTQTQTLAPAQIVISATETTPPVVNLPQLPSQVILPNIVAIKNEIKLQQLSAQPPMGYVSASTLLTPINAAAAVMFLGVLSFTIASVLTGDIVGFMGTRHVGYNMMSSLAVILSATAATYCAAYKASHCRQNAGENNTMMENTSKRPTNMAKANTHLTPSST
jgi:hypothetical protein